MTELPPETLTLSRIPTPIGEALVVADAAGVLRAFDWEDYEDKVRAWVARRYPAAALTAGDPPAAIAAALDAYFAGDVDALSQLRRKAAGTPFQQRVWDALCAIPPGQTVSYGELARTLGKPTAMRAVGLANGNNPIGLVVPCHRVIGAGGDLTGYAGGLRRKRWLLEHEGARFRA